MTKDEITTDNYSKTIEVRHKSSIEDLCPVSLSSEVSIAQEEPPVERKWWDLLKHLEPEIVMLCYTFYSYMLKPFVIHLIKCKVCRTIHPENMCFPELNDAVITQVQILAAKHIIMIAIISSVPPIFLAVLLGHWSDVHGRKLVIVFPMVGNAISAVLYVLNQQYLNWPPEYMVYSTIPSGLFGNYTVFMMGLFGWLKDNYDDHELTFKIGLGDGIEMLMMPFGPLIGGLAYMYLGGYFAVYIASVVTLGIGILITMLFIHDKHAPCSSLKTKLFDFVDIRNLKKLIKVLYVKRSEKRRTRMYLILIIMIPVTMGFFGHRNILHNYSQIKFHWDVVTLTRFNCVQGVFAAAGCFITMPILQKLLKLDAVSVTAIGSIGAIGFYLGIAFSRTTEHMYGVAFFQAIAIIALITTRSYANHCVEKIEAGKLNSIIAVMQNLCRIAASSYGNAMYQATIQSMPNAFYLFTSVLIIISVALSGFLHQVEKAALIKSQIDRSAKAKSIFD